jgi:hypothetical protein
VSDLDDDLDDDDPTALHPSRFPRAPRGSSTGATARSGDSEEPTTAPTKKPGIDDSESEVSSSLPRLLESSDRLPQVKIQQRPTLIRMIRLQRAKVRAEDLTRTVPDGVAPIVHIDRVAKSALRRSLWRLIFAGLTGLVFGAAGSWFILSEHGFGASRGRTGELSVALDIRPANAVVTLDDERVEESAMRRRCEKPMVLEVSAAGYRSERHVLECGTRVVLVLRLEPAE